MFHFTHRRIKARLLKLSNINMSVDKVLALAQTIVTIQMKRHQRIAPLFSDEFWGTH